MNTNIKSIDQLKNISEKLGAKSPINMELLDEFNSVFKEATAAMSNVDNELEKKRTKQISNERNISLDKIDQAYFAQVNPGVVQNAQAANAKDLNIVPLQIFLDNAIKSLENVSKQEFRVNDLMKKFVKGEVSEDQVVLETAKLNLAISMVTTIVQSAVQTFKEIQQIPV